MLQFINALFCFLVLSYIYYFIAVFIVVFPFKTIFHFWPLRSMSSNFSKMATKFKNASQYCTYIILYIYFSYNWTKEELFTLFHVTLQKIRTAEDETQRLRIKIIAEKLKNTKYIFDGPKSFEYPWTFMKWLKNSKKLNREQF